MKVKQKNDLLWGWHAWKYTCPKQTALVLFPANSLKRYYFSQENGVNTPPFREDGGRFPMLICRRYNFNRSIWLLCKLHKQLCGSGFRSASGWAMWAAFDVSALHFLLPSVLFWLSFELPKYAALLCRFPGTVSFIGTDKDCCFARTNGSILTVVLCVTLADSCFWKVFFSEILLGKGEEWSLGRAAFNLQNKPCQAVWEFTTTCEPPQYNNV